MSIKRVGTGTHTVLVLNGWFGSSRSWQALLPHLDREAFDYVFLDYRGYGDRRGETGRYSVAEAAADVLPRPTTSASTGSRCSVTRWADPSCSGCTPTRRTG